MAEFLISRARLRIGPECMKDSQAPRTHKAVLMGAAVNAEIAHLDNLLIGRLLWRLWRNGPSGSPESSREVYQIPAPGAAMRRRGQGGRDAAQFRFSFKEVHQAGRAGRFDTRTGKPGFMPCRPKALIRIRSLLARRASDRQRVERRPSPHRGAPLEYFQPRPPRSPMQKGRAKPRRAQIIEGALPGSRACEFRPVLASIRAGSTELCARAHIMGAQCAD